MYGVSSYVLALVVLLALAHFLLPRGPLVHLGRGRLLLRPPVRHQLVDVVVSLAGLVVVAYLGILLLAAGLLPGAVVAALVLGVLVWRAWRRWRSAAVVFDRGADAIRRGRLHIGCTSQATGVQITGARAPALVLFLREADGTTRVWSVPWVEDTQAPTIGPTIAKYLGVPLITRMTSG